MQKSFQTPNPSLDPDFWLTAHTLDLISYSNSSGFVLTDISFHQLETKQRFAGRIKNWDTSSSVAHGIHQK